MARPREFDLVEALDKATRVFWTHGYSGTSMFDLEQALGIGRTSIYGAFGGKEALFIAVVDHYSQRYSSKLRHALLVEGTLGARLDRYFDVLLEAFRDPTLPMGCLITNVAVDGDRAATPVGRKIAASIAESEDAFYQTVRARQVAGEISASIDARAVARFLVGATHGLSVLARTSPQFSVLCDVVDVTKKSVAGMTRWVPRRDLDIQAAVTG